MSRGGSLLVTFTPPQFLRDVAFRYQRIAYVAMLQCASRCLAQFGRNDAALCAEPVWV
jgi:hypothetical protein